MAFLCTRFDARGRDGINSVKQSESDGTYLHKAWGITRIFGGKTPFSIPVFCERNECRIIKMGSVGHDREQKTICTVFKGKTVIKYFSRSGFRGSYVEYCIKQAEHELRAVQNMCKAVHNKKYFLNCIIRGMVFHITALIVVVDLFI